VILKRLLQTLSFAYCNSDLVGKQVLHHRDTANSECATEQPWLRLRLTWLQDVGFLKQLTLFPLSGSLSLAVLLQLPAQCLKCIAHARRCTRPGKPQPRSYTPYQRASPRHSARLPSANSFNPLPSARRTTSLTAVISPMARPSRNGAPTFPTCSYARFAVANLQLDST